MAQNIYEDFEKEERVHRKYWAKARMKASRASPYLMDLFQKLQALFRSPAPSVLVELLLSKRKGLRQDLYDFEVIYI